jgi:hypothetical protein
VALVSVSYIFKAFIKIAMIFLEGAVMFISKGSLAIKKSFKVVKARVVDNIKGVIRRNLKQQLIIYKLKDPLVLIYSLISAFNHSIKLSL